MPNPPHDRREAVEVPGHEIELILMQQRDAAADLRNTLSEIREIREHLARQDVHLGQQDTERQTMWKRIDEMVDAQRKAWPVLQDVATRLGVIERNADGIVFAAAARKGTLVLLGLAATAFLTAAATWMFGWIKPWGHS